MSPAATSVFYGLMTLFLGLIAMATVPLELPIAWHTTFGAPLAPDLLSRIEITLFAVTAFVSTAYIANGVLGRGRSN